jgi:hypothetical protein
VLGDAGLHRPGSYGVHDGASSGTSAFPRLHLSSRESAAPVPLVPTVASVALWRAEAGSGDVRAAGLRHAQGDTPR